MCSTPFSAFCGSPKLKEELCALALKWISVGPYLTPDMLFISDVFIGETPGRVEHAHYLKGSSRMGESRELSSISCFLSAWCSPAQWERKAMVSLARFHTTGSSAEASVLLWSIKFELESTEPEEEGIGLGL